MGACILPEAYRVRTGSDAVLNEPSAPQRPLGLGDRGRAVIREPCDPAVA